MERISISLKIKDKDFKQALTRSLMETGRVNIQPHLNGRVLLLDEELRELNENGEGGIRSGQLKVILKSNQRKASWSDSIPSMYRYTPADEIVSLLEYIAGYRKRESDEGEAKVVTLISDEGGSGVSTLGINLCRMLSRAGLGAIYLCISPFAASPKEILWGESDRTGGKAWMRMLFGMRKGREGILPSVLERIEELSYVPAPRINSHADEIDQEILKGLRKEGKAMGYEYLIFDMGTHMEGKRKKILEESNTVIAVNPGYDLEGELRRRGEDRLITIVNLYREDLVEVASEKLADIHIDFIPGIGRASIDMELRKPMEKLVELIKEKEI